MVSQANLAKILKELRGQFTDNSKKNVKLIRKMARLLSGRIMTRKITSWDASTIAASVLFGQSAAKNGLRVGIVITKKLDTSTLWIDGKIIPIQPTCFACLLQMTSVSNLLFAYLFPCGQTTSKDLVHGVWRGTRPHTGL